MEELFKELEAPPPASTKAPSSSTASSWANDLAGLSQAQTTPTFSMGGAPFSAGSQPFGAAPGQFGAPRQPFGQPAPFGGQPSQQPFGAAGQPGFPGGFPQQQPTSGGFGAQPNPFGVCICLLQWIVVMLSFGDKVHHMERKNSRIYIHALIKDDAKMMMYQLQCMCGNIILLKMST